MSAKTIRRSFTLTDGAAKMSLIWHSGEALPNFGSESVVAARVAECGFEWATAETCCPECRHSFPIEATPKPGQRRAADDVGNMLLTLEAIPILMMLGNVAIDFDANMAASCPKCGKAFPVSAHAKKTEITVLVEENCTIVKCPGDRAVRFNADGTIAASTRRLLGFPTVDAEEFAAAPRYIGSSKEAKDWLSWVLGIRAEERLDGDALDLLELSLLHRFRGFGKDFISEVREFIVGPGAKQEVLNGLFALPRESSDRDALVRLFHQSGLPDKPSVRKAAATRPAALALAAKCSLGIVCGDDPNLAVSLLRSPRMNAAWCSSLLDKHGKLSGFLLLAAKEEKPAYLVKQLLNVDCVQMKKCVECYEGLGLEPFKELLAYRLARKDYGFGSIVAKPGLLTAYAKSTKSISIRYGKRESLQGEYYGYRFQLPRQTGRFASAGASLKNCLGDGYAERAALGQTLIFLVSREQDLVAAIEVHPDNMSVLQMYAKANRRIKPAEDLGVAVALWANDKHIGLSGCDYA